MTKEKNKIMKTFTAKRNISDGYSVEYRVKAENKDEAMKKIYEMSGERLKTTEA